MINNSTNGPARQSEAATAVPLVDDWFDPIEAGLRERVRGVIQAMIEAELEAALSRPRYARQPREASENTDGASAITGHRHGHRSRSLLGTFGRVESAVPRARLDTAEGKTTEWKSTALRAYQRRTKQADSLIAGAYLAGTNTRRVRRALAAVFGGAVSKDTVSRVWRKAKADWDAWNARSLAEEPIVRLILDCTALRAYQRRTKQADSLIAGAYLAGTNPRRVRRALAAVFGGAVSKDTVSRVWRKAKADWDAWNARSLAGEPIVRLILDGTVVRVRLDRKATSIVLLVVLGVREDGQKVLLAVKNMGGETSEAWGGVLHGP